MASRPSRFVLEIFCHSAFAKGCRWATIGSGHGTGLQRPDTTVLETVIASRICVFVGMMGLPLLACHKFPTEAKAGNPHELAPREWLCQWKSP